MTKSVWQNLLVVSGAERTGTTSLRLFLEATGHFWSHGEAFNPTYASKTRYFDYLARVPVSAERQDEAMMQVILNGFFEYLYSLSNDRVALLDLKLNSFSAISPLFRYPSQVPYLLEYLVEKNVPIVLTYRRNFVDQVCSLFVARAFGKWHGLNTNDIGSQTIDIDEYSAYNIAKDIIRSEDIVSKFCYGYENVYSVVVDDNRFDFSHDVRLERFLLARFAGDFQLSSQPRSAVSVYRKKDVIKNYKAIVGLLEQVQIDYPRSYMQKL